MTACDGCRRCRNGGGTLGLNSGDASPRLWWRFRESRLSRCVSCPRCGSCRRCPSYAPAGNSRNPERPLCQAVAELFRRDVTLVSEIGSRDYFPCRQWQFIKSYCRIFFLVPADDIETFVPYGLEKICRNLVRTDFNPLVEKCAKDIVKNVFGVVRGIALSSASG